MNKQAVFDGYSFSNSHGDFMVYRGEWWIVEKDGESRLALVYPGNNILDWLETFTEINPAPAGLVKVATQ